ncbi:hypothetical protein F3Y22_tig00110015pilonHSYRG00074 [Hibiscus syriacus]|uniref:Uncharacterized protein n=1 Tax=Hibiscus syriacus TaxID=106335 RepID=A0A6A3BQD7_HIBSY|nr:hypothetical protein F3Y22_tig00110015pilonHSYRG00074 [Hibiscus syriacus]
MLISTSMQAQIDEVVDVVVENMKFGVRVLEVGMVDHSLVKLSVGGIFVRSSGDKKGISTSRGGTFNVSCTGESLGDYSNDSVENSIEGVGVDGVEIKALGSNVVNFINDGVIMIEDRVMDVGVVEGRSLSDYVLKKIWGVASVEAEKTLSLAKKLGIKFVGLESEALSEWTLEDFGRCRVLISKPPTVGRFAVGFYGIMLVLQWGFRVGEASKISEV